MVKVVIPCQTHTPELKTQLKQLKLKVTPSRMEVLDILTHSKKPISIAGAKELLPQADLVTLYRTFETLENLGAVNQVDLRHGHAHYELSSLKHHHHLICTNCGKLADISKCDTADLDKQALKISDFGQISSHSLEFYGLCKPCFNKKKTHRN